MSKARTSSTSWSRPSIMITFKIFIDMSETICWTTSNQSHIWKYIQYCALNWCTRRYRFFGGKRSHCIQCLLAHQFYLADLNIFDSLSSISRVFVKYLKIWPIRFFVHEFGLICFNQDIPSLFFDYKWQSLVLIPIISFFNFCCHFCPMFQQVSRHVYHTIRLLLFYIIAKNQNIAKYYFAITQV